MLTVTPEVQFAIEEAQDVFAHNFTLYQRSDPDIDFKTCMAYALLQKYKESGEVEVHWSHMPCHNPVLNDGERLLVRTVYCMSIFYRDEQHDSEDWYLEPEPTLKDAYETLFFYDVLSMVHGTKNITKLLEDELNA